MVASPAPGVRVQPAPRPGSRQSVEEAGTGRILCKRVPDRARDPWESSMFLKHVPVFAALALLAGCATSPWDVDAFEAPGADMAGRSSFFFAPGDIAAPLVSRA